MLIHKNIENTYLCTTICSIFVVIPNKNNDFFEDL